MDPAIAGNLALICLGVWLHAADSLVIATMLPAIVADIGGVEFVAWTFALYEVGSIVAGAAAVFAVRHRGLRGAMIAMAATYMIGCAVSALAPSMETMLIGRLAQGMGGGGLVAMSFIAARRLFPAEQLPHAIAAVSALWGASAFAGPLIGGGFADAGFWRGAFWFFAVQAAALAAWIALSGSIQTGQANEDEEAAGGRFPARRLALLGFGVVAIAAGGIEISVFRSIGFVAVGVILIAAFAVLDTRAGDNRLLPPTAFDPRGGLGAPLVMIAAFGMATIAISIYGPLIMTLLYGVSALTAGYVIALSSIGWSLAAVITAGAHERHDGRLIFAGMATLTASIIGFLVVMPNGPFWLIPAFALIEGAGFGMAWTFILRRASAISPPRERDRLASAMPTVHRLGYATGAAVIGIAANGSGFAEGVSVDAARTAGFWVFAAGLPFAAIGLFAAWRFVRQAPGAVT